MDGYTKNKPIHSINKGLKNTLAIVTLTIKLFLAPIVRCKGAREMSDRRANEI